ncbi:hypothetical protein D3C84_932750 [compost metagenome]
MHAIDISHHQINALGAQPTGLIGLAHQAAVVSVAHGTEHDHAVAEAQLGMGDAAIFFGHYQVLDEAEGVAKPGDGGGRVAVTQAGNGS